MQKRLLLIVVNIAVLCTLLVIIELTGQVIYFLIHGKLLYQVKSSTTATNVDSEVFEYHPFFAARLRQNARIVDPKTNESVTITAKHTRWTGAPENDSNLIKIAVVGGSTTFCTSVTDKDSWPAILQAKLGNKFSVINYGVPGYSTVDAIIQLALIIPEEKPDFIIFYEGWNDIYLYHSPDLTPDYYIQGIGLQDVLEVPRYREQTLLEKLNDISAIVRISSKIKSKLSVPIKTHPCIKYDSPDPLVDRLYIRNLKTMKILSENIAEYTLFVPQVMNYDWFMNYKDPEICNAQGDDNIGPRYIKSSAMPRLLDRFNLFMKSVCSSNDRKCIFVQEISDVDWEPTDFVDMGHFSKSGNEKFADIISQVILTKIKQEE